MNRAGRQSETQRGQALVLGMLLTGVAAVALMRYFSTGEVVAAKAKQLHALDAAAYSGALIQARALNMLAYLNRAQTGHQVAMAHLVTLGSWAAMGGTQARQLSSGNPPAHLIAMLFGPHHGAGYAAARAAAGFDALAQTEGELAQAYAAHDNVVHALLSSVQDDIVAGLPDARWAAMQAVLAQNYAGSRMAGKILPKSPDRTVVSPRADSKKMTYPTFDLIVTEDNWPGYVQRYSGRQSLRPFIQDIAQLYDFLSPRNHKAVNPWVVDPACPAQRHELRRRGATELDAHGRWQSADTESFHALRSNRWIGCYYREYPMGWGWIPSAPNQQMDGPYVDSAPDNFAAQDFWRWVKEATNWDIFSGDANPLANSKAMASRQRWPGGGLPQYFDIDPAVPAQNLRFSVELKHPGPEGLLIATRSAGETIFDRPEARTDSRYEASNLFHPYWQARLAVVDSYASIGGHLP